MDIEEIAKIPINNGFLEDHFECWDDFSSFLMGDFVELNHYVFRGQADSAWKLEPTLDRLLKELPEDKHGVENTVFRHLSCFQKSVRGRRGNNPPLIEGDDDWWALGQHHGLATSLLDWSSSPFVACYFAFMNAGSEGNVAVYALNMKSVVDKMYEYEKRDQLEQSMYFVSPMSNENKRLLSQSGLFTRTPYLKDVSSWIEENFPGNDKEAQLCKFTIPCSERLVALKALNRMNINSMTLFPDLIGASSFCNMALQEPNYHYS